MNTLRRALDIYRVTSKADDFLWARYPSRPFAALFLAIVHPLRLTPNFITVVSLLVGLASCALFVVLPGYSGLLIAWGVCQLAYVIDCMDGMQARYEGLRSPVGVSFDYLVDAIKQFFVFPAIAVRLFWDPGAGMTDPFAWLGVETGPTGWLYVAALSGPIVAAPLAMTSFMRSPAYTGSDTVVIRPRRGPVMKAISFLLNYPSWILLPVLLERMDLFLWISIPLYAVYAGFDLLLISRELVPHSHYEQAAGRTHGDDAG
jgi:phosphatidylglycerophosphate synthase